MTFSHSSIMIPEISRSVEVVSALMQTTDGTGQETLRAIKSCGFRQPGEVRACLERIVDKFLTNKTQQKLLPFIIAVAQESADPISALSHFDGYLDVAEDYKSTLSYFSKNKKSLVVLLRSFGASNFIAEVICRNPGISDWLFIPEGLTEERKKKRELSRHLKDDLKSARTTESRMRVMRRFRDLEMVRIILKDMFRLADFKTIVAEISDLAEVCLEEAYRISLNGLKKDHGRPYTDDGSGKMVPAGFAVIGMGKLGGKELNYSSDVDLLFVYSGEGETAAAGKSADEIEVISNHEFYCMLSREIVSLLGDVTEAGFVFRVDMRLRPEGAIGPLARSLDSYELYYSEFGENWERQALIKSRPVAGDAKVGEEFLKMVSPFVFRRYFDSAAFQEMRQIKSTIDQQIDDPANEGLDIKRGNGGIREIEFIVQYFQMTYGGRYEKLKVPGTLAALEVLKSELIIGEKDYSLLRNSYIFLRNVEHNLQVEDDFQTHSVPDNREAREKLARRLGYGGRTARNSFMKELDRVMVEISKVFERLFKSRDVGLRVSPLMRLLLSRSPDPEALAREFAPFGIEEHKRAYQNLRSLMENPSRVAGNPRLIEFYSQLADLVLVNVSRTPDPDRGMNNFDRFFTGTGMPYLLLTSVIKNPPFLTLIIECLARSQYLADLMIGEPGLFDTISTSPEYLVKPPGREEMEAVFRKRLEHVKDFDERLSLTRVVKKEFFLQLGMASILDKLEFGKISVGLSDLADAVLARIYDLIHEQMTAEYGKPEIREGRKKRKARFAVIALGKLGGQDMGFQSDLDILFVGELDGNTTGGKGRGKKDRSIPNSEFFHLMSSSLTSTIIANTADGQLYDVDTRLRPAGGEGELCQPLEWYPKYFEEQGMIWERQAMTRARYVAGDPDFGQEVIDTLRKITYRKTRPEELRNSIRNMKEEVESTLAADEDRNYIKLGPGGMMAIDFLIQYLLLRYGHADESIRKTGTVDALEALGEGGYISGRECRQLCGAYNFLRKVRGRLWLVEGLRVDSIPDSREGLMMLARQMGHKSLPPDEAADSLISDYNKHVENVKAIWKRYMETKKNKPQK